MFYAFNDIEFSELFHHFASLDILKFTLSIIILMFACIIRAKRLKYIISPLDNNITTHHLFGATMIGYFGNGILFFRLGELLKAYSSIVMKKDFLRINIPKLPVLTTEDGINRIKIFLGKLLEWKNITELLPKNFKKTILNQKKKLAQPRNGSEL